MHTRLKARLTDPKCIHLKWRNAIFDNHFTKLKIYPLQSLLSLVKFLKITLARITPYTGGQVREIYQNPQYWKVPQITLEGHGMSKDAQTKLEGMKKNNPKDTKELSFSQKKNWYDDAQPSEERKNKWKSPSPTLGGTIDHFGKTFKWQKVKKQAQVILSLEIP